MHLNNRIIWKFCPNQSYKKFYLVRSTQKWNDIKINKIIMKNKTQININNKIQIKILWKTKETVEKEFRYKYKMQSEKFNTNIVYFIIF